MNYKNYLRQLLIIIQQQKVLTIIIVLIFIMLIGVFSAPLISNKSKNKSLTYNPQTNAPTQSPQQSSQQPTQSAVNAPSPTDLPLTKKFIYVIQSFIKPNHDNSQSTNQSGSGGSRYRSGSSTAPTGNQSNPSNPSNSSNSSGGGSGSNGGSSQGGLGQQTNPPQPTPTPVTDIQIKFVKENGEYWTYVAPAIPPINTNWVKYINYQDHYSIEYPSDWVVIKSNYNGHEGITLYMPGDTGNIDKPSIAFVGWKADYLNSMSSYSGPIILRGTPGTIYTNGAFGISSVAAVFQYNYGYFALGSSTSNDIFMYVFDHMLRSIEFNIN